MSANLEQHNDRLLVLRIGGELKNPSSMPCNPSSCKKSLVPEPSGFSCCWKTSPAGSVARQWGDTDFFFSHRNDFEKIAVVGNPRWEAQVLAFTGAGLRKGPVKFFPETGESEARAWLAE